MDYFRSMGVEARTRLEQLKVQIDALNDKKDQILRAHKGESARHGDLDFGPPAEVRGINGELAELYSEREGILRQHPELETEYGGKKRLQTGPSPLSRGKTAYEKQAKKQRRLENLERRREEDRARAHGGTGGSKKKGKK